MIPRAAPVALRIWAGSVITAMTAIRDPQRGQAITSSSWTLDSSRAQALRQQSASTSRSSVVPEGAGSAAAFLPYQLAGARERRAGRSFQVPRPREVLPPGRNVQRPADALQRQRSTHDVLA